MWESFLDIVAARTKKDSNKRLTAVALLLLPVMIAAGVSSARPKGLMLWASWAIIAGGMIVFLAMLGLQTHGRIGGILINDRNLMSVSRLQIVAWTLLIASAFATVGLARVFSGEIDDPLNIAIPTEVWQLLGLSGASTLGASLVTNSKKRKPVADTEAAVRAAAAQLRAKDVSEPVTDQEVATHRKGVLYANPDSRDARFVDMFEGDELGNTAFIDITKVQMLFFTVVALITYGAELFELMSGPDPYNIASFPEVTQGLLTVLLISHATYLGNKSMDHTSASTNRISTSDATSKEGDT